MVWVKDAIGRSENISGIAKEVPMRVVLRKQDNPTM
jgi:hypothetical protein